MKVLLTGATGYIGKRLLPALLEQGHQVVCGVRDKQRFQVPDSVMEQIEVVEIDLTQPDTLSNIPNDIHGAYYLVHSMSTSTDYQELEKKSAINFRERINETQAQHVVYLSGIINEDELSEHLNSRKQVELELDKGRYHLTTLRAGIIIGSGSASFEIIRDLVEKLPVMITPIWLKTKCQPIGISDVIKILTKTLFRKETYDQNFDIGGPDILSYKEMLLEFARVRKLKRSIYVVPVMTPRLSSYWLYFVTSTSYMLATALVDSMKVEVVCRNNDLIKILGVKPIAYREALQRAFQKIENNAVLSSWKDAHASSGLRINISEFVEVPSFGCFKDKRERKVCHPQVTLNRIWKIGGNQGWYYANGLWQIRGVLDKLIGGVGLRRGRTNIHTIEVGDALDFWRVLYANKEEGRLLLWAEMKLPGEAWLEFRLEGDTLVQTATFRPLGIMGRLYWYAVVPLHEIVFRGMITRLAK